MFNLENAMVFGVFLKNLSLNWWLYKIEIGRSTPINFNISDLLTSLIWVLEVLKHTLLANLSSLSHVDPVSGGGVHPNLKINVLRNEFEWKYNFKVI